MHGLRRRHGNPKQYTPPKAPIACTACVVGTAPLRKKPRWCWSHAIVSAVRAVASHAALMMAPHFNPPIAAQSCARRGNDTGTCWKRKLNGHELEKENSDVDALLDAGRRCCLA